MRKHRWRQGADQGIRGSEAQRPTVGKWLWWSVLGLLATVLIVGFGLAASLALGWRSPTPRRAPDWIGSKLVWRPYGDGFAAPTGDGFKMHLSQPQQRAWAIADQSAADFDVELDIRSVIASEDVGYGLLYRYQNQDNYYLFAIGGDGYYTIAVVRDGELAPLRSWQQWPHIRRGIASNRLRVRCQRSVCRFHINGEFTAQIKDSTFLAGRLGLWVQSFSDASLDVVFGEMRLWLLN